VVGYFFEAIGYPPLDCWTTDRIIFSNAVHARLPKGHDNCTDGNGYDIDKFMPFIEISGISNVRKMVFNRTGVIVIHDNLLKL
jgi:hypothetical protein